MSLVHQNWWFTTLLVRPHKFCPPLSKSLKCDVLIVGGGANGISAAAEFVAQERSFFFAVVSRMNQPRSKPEQT